MNQEIEKLKTDYMLLSHQHSQGELELSIKTLENKALREELEKLRADKESLLVRVEEVRDINKQLEHEMLLVKRNNKDLEAENERLKEENGELIISNEILYQSNLHYSEQTQKLREALEWYANSKNYVFSESRITPEFAKVIETRAKETLKGGSDE